MGNNTVLFTYIVLRSLCVLAAVGGTVYLAYHGKDGWGWLIFLAVCLGMYSLEIGQATD